MKVVIEVIAPFLLNRPVFLSEELNTLEVKNKATIIFVSMVKKLKNRTTVSAIPACLFCIIKTNCAITANQPISAPSISIFFRIPLIIKHICST
jgi:hypothetical protein